MSASWYDVLGVDAAASTDEIRAAWRSATDDLDPTDRRFDLYNEAAKVLLDPQARATYDRVSNGTRTRDVSDDDTVADMPANDSTAAADPVSAPGIGSVVPSTGVGAGRLRSTATRLAAPNWLVGALALAVLLVAGVATYLSFSGPDTDRSRDAAREASAVAQDSFGNVLTYRWDDLATAHQRASALLTGDYRAEFDKVWSLVETEAVKVKAVVSTEVIRTGVVRASDDGKRVELVVVIRNSVSNAGGDQGTGYLMLGVTMVDKDGSWLISAVDGLDGGDDRGTTDSSVAPGDGPSDDTGVDPSVDPTE